MKLTVMISTFKRAPSLRRCCDALRSQTRLPDELIIVTRRGDRETEQMMLAYDFAPLALRWTKVDATGLVAALNTGLEEVSGEIVAFTDDDAVPRPDWLARIEAHFRADPGLGGVGGRDWIVEDGRPLEGTATEVNRVQWFGRVIGNNHLGVGPPREVDVLKGANMSFRRQAIANLRFDQRLHGAGAQVHIDHSFALAVKRAGWKLVYDPSVAVDHYPAPRFDADQRRRFDAFALRNAVHNETLGALEYLPPLRRIVFLVYAVVVGTWAAPGLLQWIRMAWKGTEAPTGRLIASLRGRADAWRTMRSSW